MANAQKHVNSFGSSLPALVVLLSGQFWGCSGKRECDNPGEYSYEGNKAYTCVAENGPGDGTKKILLFQCKRPEFSPLVYEYDENKSEESSNFIFTCLDPLGNIEIPKLSDDTSLYCSPERSGTWVRLLFNTFSHKVYHRCQDFKEGEAIPNKYSDAAIAQMEFTQEPFRDDSLVICPRNEANVSTDPTKIDCQEKIE